MAVRTKEEILELINTRIGEDTSDDAIAMIEDITDTLDDYQTRLDESGDWRARYEENDAAWRARYKARFFGSADEDPEEAPEDPEEPEEKTTFEELFTEK